MVEEEVEGPVTPSVPTRKGLSSVKVVYAVWEELSPLRLSILDPTDVWILFSLFSSFFSQPATVIQIVSLQRIKIVSVSHPVLLS